LGRSVALVTQGCRLRSNPGLEFANAFGVNPGLELANAFGVVQYNRHLPSAYTRWHLSSFWNDFLAIKRHKKAQEHMCFMCFFVA